MGNPLDGIDSLELERTIDLIVDRTFAMDFRGTGREAWLFTDGQAARHGHIEYMERLAVWVDDSSNLDCLPSW